MADQNSTFEVLQQEVKQMANKMSSWSEHNKRRSFKIYIGIAFSSVVVTILVAVASDLPKEWGFILKLTTLCFSGLGTLLAAWEGFFNHKQLWINYGETRNQLKSLQLRMDLMSADDQNNETVLGEIYLEYQKILHNSNVKWKELRSEEANPK